MTPSTPYVKELMSQNTRSHGWVAIMAHAQESFGSYRSDLFLSTLCRLRARLLYGHGRSSFKWEAVCHLLGVPYIATKLDLYLFARGEGMTGQAATDGAPDFMMPARIRRTRSCSFAISSMRSRIPLRSW